ncbi:RNA polymerase factor sigma-54 [Caryophanon tenue]|uniref:RNA polymerase sigma-54 factor n=1 Tax=Caryophanon tenue TaxID=33978 RepID=A0A1C0Y633_9BACL|nr:RNA polymerase factor sigma-54 [Caryophanon tenue]OCS82601.1 RNA polymerase sigma-54 factor [Caryophanon tenue]
MNFELHMSQQLQQTLTTEQLQHLEVLQLSDRELEQFLYDKAAENPLLDVTAPSIDELQQTLALATMSSRVQRDGSFTDRTAVIEQTIAAKSSSLDALIEQIPLHANLHAQDRRILKYLIYNLNDAYFLDVCTHEVAERFEVTEAHVLDLLYLLQSFEPVGVGARNATEYLLIQIDQDLYAPPLAATFVEHHLDEIANLSLQALSKRYRISLQETQQIVQYIRSLRPSPSQQQQAVDEGYIIPEVVVEYIDDTWVIQIQHALRPTIQLNEEYVAMLKGDAEHEAYYATCLKQVMLLTQGIEQRDRTLYRLANYFVEQQTAFLEKGLQALTPVRLKDVAEHLSLHESTISRAIRHKYMKTPHGTYALRSLFVKGLINQTGKIDSVMYVKQRIEQLIAAESHEAPLSDQMLTETLQQEGIQISRRTVAKYREELNIRSSAKRVHLYRLQLS